MKTFFLRLSSVFAWFFFVNFFIQGLKFDEMVSSSSSNSSEEESFNQEDQLDELLLNESDDDDDQLLESSNHNKEVEVTSDVFTNAPFISTNSAKSFSSIQTKDQTAPNPQPTSSTNPFDSAPFPSTKPLSKDIFGSSPFLVSLFASYIFLMLYLILISSLSLMSLLSMMISDQKMIICTHHLVKIHG